MTYFSSAKVHCAQCSQPVHEGRIRYSHSLIAPVLVAPGSSQVFSLEPEFIQPQDGREKQDCEQNATHRWLSRHADRLPASRTTFLADDLYCKQPFCAQLEALHSHYLLVCLPESHPTLYSEIALLDAAGLLETHRERVWNGRFHEQYRYRFTNAVPLRADAEALLVNWCEVSVVHAQTGERLDDHTFATNFPLRAGNVAQLVRSARARWKTENENHNTFKNRGYHLEHNFGHGQQHLAALLVVLNWLAFLLHTVLLLTEQSAQSVRPARGTLETFWTDMRTLTRYFYFRSWVHLLDFMATQLELAAPPPN